MQTIKTQEMMSMMMCIFLQPLPNPFCGTLSRGELRKRAKTQLNFEISGSVMVDSIEPSGKVTANVKKAVSKVVKY